MPVLDNAECISKNLDQVLLLAAAEESFCQAAVVLQPLLRDIVSNPHTMDYQAMVSERLSTGLALLEEAMAAHNRYMDSLK